MWTIQHLLLSLTTALTCKTSAADVIYVFGYEGKDVELSCSYGEGYEDYEKYLCNKNCDWEDILIKTSETAKTKYSVSDDKNQRIFTATISDLHSIDAGTYWCAVSRTGKDIYTEVHLEIRPDSCCDTVVKIQSYEEGSVSIDCPYESEYSNNLKYICKGSQPSTCLQQAMVTSETQQNTRFRLTDEKTSRKFTVNIASLSLRDSGPYLCGVHRDTELDVFSALELEVKEWCCERTQSMSGTVGRSLTLQCSYPPQHRDNKKFLCKGSKRISCVDVLRTQSRFSLHSESSSSFQVTISRLEAGDAGMYWCGSDSQWSVAEYTKIHLSVAYQQETRTVKTGKFITSHHIMIESSHSPEQRNKDAASYVVYVVPAVLLPILTMVVILMVIVYKRKSCRDKGAEVTTNCNKPKEVCMQEVTAAADIYENHDAMIMHSKVTSKHQNVCYHSDSTDGEEQDYENFTTTEEIYCNEFYHKANKR